LSGLDPRRLRLGEIVAGVSGVLLLVFMFALPWYGLTSNLRETAANLGQPTSWNGWNGLETLRWLLLVTIVAALALAYFQAVREGPAIPLTLSVIVTLLGGLSTVALIYRVLINSPAPTLDQRVGAYLGLVAAIGITYGGYKSMREEGGADLAALDIETIKLRNALRIGRDD
jgi:FtsH-binding integral membrane protein